VTNQEHWRWIALLVLGLLLLAIAMYGRRSAATGAVNRQFAIQTLVVTWWVIGIAGIHSAHATEAWGRWTFAAAALMPAGFLGFAEVFPTRDRPLPRLVSRPIYLGSSVLAAVALATPWIAHDFVVQAGVLTRSPGPLMGMFSTFFLSSAAVIFAVLLQKWRRARGLARAQLRLYYLGLLLFCVGAITTNLVFPYVSDDSRYSTLGPCFVLVFLAFVAHGIIRYRFMNVRLVVHNWLTISLASVVSLLPLVFAARLFPPTRGLPATTSWLSSMVPLLVAGLASPPLWIATRFLLHRYVYRGDADFRTLITEASDQLARVLSPRETAAVITRAVVAAVRPEGVAIYFNDGVSDRPLRIHSHQTEGFGTPETLPTSVTQELQGVRLLASFQSVPADAGHAPSDGVSAILDENHWALIIPLNVEDQMIGAIAIGGKLAGDPYYLEDIRLLQVLGTQAAVAFKNGQLYERILLANQHIANIVETVQSGIVVAYDRDSVKIMNEAALRLLGFTQPLELCAVLSLDEIPQPLACLLIQTLELGTSTRTGDLVVPRKDGVAMHVMCSTAPLRRADGLVVGVVAALSDLSTVRELEVERGRAERLNYFETLAAGLAHEIANPIAPIKLMTQLLPARHHDETFIRDFTRTVTREISRMQKLVERLHSLSRPARRERTPIDLRAILQDAVDVMQSLFSERGISLSVSLCDEPLTVHGDASELQELFLNLLTNGMEATSPTGNVTVEALRDSDAAVARVADTGSGIPLDICDRIFEPFVSSKQRGSGLGLAICRGIVKRHQGSINAENTERGALFSIRIPLASE
jgi:signal transduction histidine kinase